MPDDSTLNDMTLLHAEVPRYEPDASAKASLVCLSGWEIGREIGLASTETLFGRSVEAKVIMNVPSVSREHAKVSVHAEGVDMQYKVVDLNSRNGTYVNNNRITEAILANGDKVQMGDVVFKFVLQDDLDQQFHQDVHRLIHYDQLTGLLTMDAFWRRLETEMRRSSYGKRRFSLAMTDLDGLKRVNDTHGHLAGRMVVREMGVMIRQTVRPIDYAALYGGDEAIMLYAAATLDEAEAIAEKLRLSIQDRVFEHAGKNFGVTISQGLAEWPTHGLGPDQLIAAADAALYAAKAAGRNCIRRASQPAAEK